jgi:hypothetical protein
MEDKRYFGKVCISRYLGCEVILIDTKNIDTKLDQFQNIYSIIRNILKLKTRKKVQNTKLG